MKRLKNLSVKKPAPRNTSGGRLPILPVSLLIALPATFIALRYFYGDISRAFKQAAAVPKIGKNQRDSDDALQHTIGDDPYLADIAQRTHEAR